MSIQRARTPLSLFATGLLVLLFAPAEAQVETSPSVSTSTSVATSTEASSESPYLDFDAVLESVAEDQKAEFSSSAYAFCNDPDFDMERQQPRAATFCKVFTAEMLAVCPNAKRVCELGAEEAKFEWPAWLLDALLVVLAIVVLGLFFYLLAGLLGGRVPAADLDLSVADEPGLALKSLPDAPAVVILKQARARLEQSDPARAAVLLQVAMLRYLEDAGLIRFHASTTNGEYLRRVRRYKDLAALYRTAAHETDRLRFGDGQVDAHRIHEAVDVATRLLETPFDVARYTSAATLLLALSLFLSGCTGGGPSFFSHSPDGLAALPALLSRAGVNVKVLKKTPEVLPEGTGVMVVRTSDVLFGGGKYQIDRFLDEGWGLVVLHDDSDPAALLPLTRSATTGDFDDTPEPIELVMTPETFCGFDHARVRQHLGDREIVVPRSPALAWDGRASSAKASKHVLTLVPLLVRKDAENIYRGPTVAFAATRLDEAGESLPGCMVLFSSSDLFTNASMTRTANLEFVTALLTSMVRRDERIVFIDSLEQHSGAGGVPTALRAGRLLGFIVHAGLFVVLLFIAVGAAFGPLRDPVVVTHKAFIEHVRAVGRHYARAGVPGIEHAARAMARYVVSKNRHRVRGQAADGWLLFAEELAAKFELETAHVRDALSLGLEGALRTEVRQSGTRPDPTRALQTLSTLLSGGVETQHEKGFLRRR